MVVLRVIKDSFRFSCHVSRMVALIECRDSSRIRRFCPILQRDVLQQGTPAIILELVAIAPTQAAKGEGQPAGG